MVGRATHIETMLATMRAIIRVTDKDDCGG
jgi:hypothetical protein